MSENSPLVTIVTPSYNQGAFLEQTIRSVLEQDYPNIEYVVVDGGSTDGSVDIIRRYEARLAWWESGPDEGQASALNGAFARSRGELLGWLNSDDTLLPGSVSLAVETLQRNPDALLAYGDAIFTDTAGRRIGYFCSTDLDVVEMVRTCTDHINPQGALFRRPALAAAGPLEGFYCWDFEFVLRIGLAGRAIRIERPLATFRIHAASKSASASRRKAEDYLRMYNRFFGDPGLPPEVRRVEAEGRAAALVWAGELFYAAGDHRRARSCYLEAVRRFPHALSPRLASFVARTFVPPAVTGALRRFRRHGVAVTG